MSRFHSYGIPDKLGTLLDGLHGAWITDSDLSILFAETYPQLFTTLGYPLVVSGRTGRGPSRTLARYLNAGLDGMRTQLAAFGIEVGTLLTPLAPTPECRIYRARGGAGDA